MASRWMTWRKRTRRDQRGVVLVMAVPGLVLAIVSLALSVDIGRQVLEKRTDQKVADMAALDAVRDLPDAQNAARAAAERNGFDPDQVVAERGSVDADRVFTLDPTGDAVRVTVTSSIGYIFAPGSKTVTAKAVAQLPGPPPVPAPQAGFMIGSSLASVDTTKASLLNAVLGKWLKGAASTGGTADVVGWQGLVSSNVTLGALRDQLELLDAGVQFGTVDELLAADITLAKLAQATANALSAAGDSRAALYAGPTGIIAQSTNTTTFKLGKLIEVAQGGGDAALATQLNVFQLLSGSAMVANGTNAVSVPGIGISLPGITGTSLSLKVIEGQKMYFGPAGNGVSTGQVELTLTPTLNRSITVDGLTDARLTGAFPLTMTAGGATGTLSTITCSDPGAGIRVAVDLKPLSASTSTTLKVYSKVLLASVAVADVATTGGLALTDPTPQNVDFAYPGEFTPTAAPKRVGSSPLGLETRSAYNTNVSSLGIVTLPLNLGAVVAGDLKLVSGLLDANVMKALHDTLGVSVGAADVWASKKGFEEGCATPPPPPPGTPKLVG